MSDLEAMLERIRETNALVKAAPPHRVGAPEPAAPASFTREDILDHYAEESGTFPVDALGDPCLPIAQYFAEKSGLPLHCSALIALTALGACVKGGLVVRSIDNYVCHPNLMTLHVYPTGFGKTNLARDFMEPLFASYALRRKKFDEEERYELMAQESEAKRKRAQFERTGAYHLRDDYKEALATLDRVRSALAQHPGIFSNVTEQALIRKMSLTHGWGFMVNTEASDMLSIIMGQYSGVTGGETFTKGYSGESHHYERVGSDGVGASIHIPRLVLACLWMTHPDQIVRMCANPRLLEMGFLARFITCSFTGEVRAFSSRNGHLNPSYLREYHQAVYSLEKEFLHDSDELLCIERDPDVEAYWKEERDLVQAEHVLSPAAVKTFQIRRVEHGIKIAAVLHLAMHQKHSLKVSMDKATAVHGQQLAKWYVDASQAVYLKTDTPHGLSKPQRIAERLGKCLDRRMSWRDVSRAYRMLPGDMQQLLDAFPTAFSLLEERVKGGVRKVVELTDDKDELTRLGLISQRRISTRDE